MSNQQIAQEAIRKISRDVAWLPEQKANDIYQEEIAVLTVRVRRQPASLANCHYHIEPGKKVYVTYRYPNGRVQVSTLESKYRCSEDYFTVPISALDFASI